MKFKARCSRLKELMTDPRTKKEKEAGELSETAKTYVLEQFLADRYNFRRYVESKYMTKGRELEEDGLTLYQMWLREREGENILVLKNEDRITNDYLTGTYDTVADAKIIADIKVAWDLQTFHTAEGLKTKTDALTAYGWQLVGYGLLTKIKRLQLVYTLHDAPEWMISDAQRREYYKCNPALRDEPEFDMIEKAVENAMRFDVDDDERVRVWELALSDKEFEDYQERVKARVEQANKHYQKLEDQWINEQFYKRV